MLPQGNFRQAAAPNNAATAKNIFVRSPDGPHRHRAIAIALGAIFAGLHPSFVAADNPAEALELPTLEVVGTTPLPGLGTSIRDVPANVQVYTSKELGRQRQTNIGEYLEQNPTCVTINSSQGNPFQADVNFRGFTASPILGTPQGLSVFQDGVRINEPFGDVVNWDLIPPSAISSLQLIPGSNPAFGLNTLGGALGIYTKSGSQYPGGALEAYAGSFGRKGASSNTAARKTSWIISSPPTTWTIMAGLSTTRAPSGNSSARWAGRTTRPTST